MKQLMARGGHDDVRSAARSQHATQERDQVIADALAAFVKPAPVIPIREQGQ
jgi:hypothetical protein